MCVYVCTNNLFIYMNIYYFYYTLRVFPTIFS